MAKPKHAVPRPRLARGQLVIDALDRPWPGFARTVRARLELGGEGFPKDAFGPNAPPGLDLLARFIGEQRRQYPDAAVAKEVARRFLEIIQGADPATVLKLKRPAHRPKGSRVTDQRITDAMRTYLEKHALPFKRGTLERAYAAVGAKLSMDPDKVRRHWKKFDHGAYEWNRWLKEKAASY